MTFDVDDHQEQGGFTHQRNPSQIAPVLATALLFQPFPPVRHAKRLVRPESEVHVEVSSNRHQPPPIPEASHEEDDEFKVQMR